MPRARLPGMSQPEDKTIPGMSGRPSALPYRPFGRRRRDIRPAAARPGSRQTIRPGAPRIPRKRRRSLPPLGLLLLVASLSFGIAFATSGLLSVPTAPASSSPTPVTVQPDMPEPGPAPAGSAPRVEGARPNPAAPTTQAAPTSASPLAPTTKLLDRRSRPFTPKRVSDLKANPFVNRTKHAGAYTLAWRKVSDLKRNPFL
ncbi:MAG: hypothetical protein ACI9MR_004731 [Myxococcota bacterium]|jgi:hypothetical protein